MLAHHDIFQSKRQCTSWPLMSRFQDFEKDQTAKVHIRSRNSRLLPVADDPRSPSTAALRTPGTQSACECRLLAGRPRPGAGPWSSAPTDAARSANNLLPAERNLEPP